MKKIHSLPFFAMLLMLLAITLTVTACSGNANTQTTVTTTDTAPVTTAPITTVPVTTAPTTTNPVTTAPVTTTPVTTVPVTTTPITTTPITTAPVTTTPVTTAPVTTTPETTEAGPEWINAVFGGGPFTTGLNMTVNRLKDTDYNTLMLWSVHVQENGDLHMNDIAIVRDGKLANRAISRTWEAILQNCPNIKRIELSIGGWGCKDFENIRDLIAKEGTGEDSILYKNFKCLMEATKATAVNYDDESCYDVNSAVAFGKMCLGMGMKVTLCPYTNKSFWQNVFNKLGKAENVDRVYLQCYAGGAGNNPSDWVRSFPGADLVLGYWCNEKSPEEVTNTLKRYQNIAEGGFMWLFDDMQNNGTVDDYASAVQAAGEGKQWD